MPQQPYYVTTTVGIDKLRKNVDDSQQAQFYQKNWLKMAFASVENSHREEINEGTDKKEPEKAKKNKTEEKLYVERILAVVACNEQNHSIA